MEGRALKAGLEMTPVEKNNHYHERYNDSKHLRHQLTFQEVKDCIKIQKDGSQRSKNKRTFFFFT